MTVSRTSLNKAAQQKIISQDQADKLYAFLNTEDNQNTRFNFTHLLYYLGGLIAIGAMTLFMNLGWESFGGWGIVAIASIYAVIGVLLTNNFKAKGFATPASLCATFVVALTPLAVYGLQQGLGIWPDETVYRDYHHYIKWHWLYMELATIAVGIMVIKYYKYPFLVMPIAVTLWYMSMDLTPVIGDWEYDFNLQAKVSMYFGLVMTVLAVWVDFRSMKSGDYAFWLYLFGVIAFWGGLTAQESDSELAKFFYCLINLGLMAIGITLVRRIFVIAGALGVSIYLTHLAENVFKNSWLFPIALTAIGLAIIYLGVLWQRNEAQLTYKIRKLLPVKMQELLASKTR